MSVRPAAGVVAPRGRRLLSAILVVGGVLHFVAPGRYLGIVPPYLPAPLLLVYLSGLAEAAGGLGLFLRWRPPLIRWYVTLLLLAIVPANVEMLRQGLVRGVPWWGAALLWLRLPLQVLIIWWAWRLTANAAPPLTGEAGPM